ncbi:Transposon Tf2-12 polyprotein [Sparassis crispa]|uniref:Transposon Tf2-12 polyprotein n=1 Tax=Sparassis crispa TaxID=139825 RepID=A0A401GBR9_9APHY|nr:Transposon Tf2-12 polyprotein [Sparassis crispa]GBE79602.1 Transposon Tf2-12 polyprotein [Sparassis crispa]
MSTAYHPQSDGETERVNQELEVYLRLYCGNNPESWVDQLPDLEFCHNTREHSVRKMSSFRMMMGYEPRGILSVLPRKIVPSVETRLSELQKIRDEALAMHELVRQHMAERIRKGSPHFAKGQKVWLDTKNLNIGYPTRKMAPKREGPFIIEERIGPVDYRLTLPRGWRIHPVFHASLLSPYKETEIHSPNDTRPPPDLIEEHEEYEVEAILNHRQRYGWTQYLVKWKGYASAENSWEPEANLTNAKGLLGEYKRRRCLRRISAIARIDLHHF